MLVDFRPQKVCSTRFHADISEEGVIESLTIENGCDGNGKGIARLVQGRHMDEVITLLEGIRCGRKQTSCPDQLARMLKEVKANRADG